MNNIIKKTTKVTIIHKDEKTIVSNDFGIEFDFNGYIDDETAIASMVFKTLKIYFNRTMCYSSEFTITMEIESK